MTIRSETRGQVLLITMDRPDARNAINQSMSRALIEVWEKFRSEAGLRAAVLTGAGDKAFCAGADLKEIAAFHAGLSPIERRELGERQPGLGGITRNLDVGKPVIAAINGHCLAGGLEIALACDLRVACEAATFGLPEVKRGIIPGAGGTQRLPRLMGLARAKEWVLTGDIYDAKEAERLGLISRVVPQEKLMETAKELARKILSRAPLAVRLAKLALNASSRTPLESGLTIEMLAQSILFESKDKYEGMTAYLEKRKAHFTGE